MDINDLIKYLITPVAQVGLIIGLAEVLKKSGVPSRWIPIADLVMGLISGIGFYGYAEGHGLANGVLVGLALGLSACGLFSGIKNVAGWDKDDIQTTFNEDGEDELLEVQDETENNETEKQ